MRRPKSVCASCPKCSGEYSALTPPPQLKLPPRSNKDDHGSRCNRRCVTRVRPAAKFSRATAVVVSMPIAINPVDKSLIVVIELVLLALDGAATLARFSSQ